MELYILVISVILTLIILWLSIVTISKGYGYKHKIDPPIDPLPQDIEKPKQSYNHHSNS